MHITGQASSSALHNQATLLLAEFQEGGLSASSGSWQGRAGQGGDGEEARVSLCMGLAQLVVLDGGVYESQTRFYGT